MSATPGTPGSSPAPWRRWALIGIIIGLLGIAVAVGAVWYYLYGTAAPEAPTIDGALELLLPSPSP